MIQRHKVVHSISQIKNEFNFSGKHFHSCVAIALSASIRCIAEYTYRVAPKYPNTDVPKIFGFAETLLNNTYSYNEIPNCTFNDKTLKKVRKLIKNIEQNQH